MDAGTSMTTRPAENSIELEKLELRDTAEQAVLAIVNSIRRTDLRPGERLPNLPELAGSLGIARDNVRRALQILSDAGVVETRRGHNGGTTLLDASHIPSALSQVLRRSLTTEGAWEDLIAVRRLLQPEAARLVARRADGLVLARLDRHVNEIKLYLSEENVEKSLYAATELNYAIASNCGNEVLADMLIRTIDRISVIGFLSSSRLKTLRPTLEQILKTQEDLVEAIHHRNEELIAKAILDQMDLSLSQAIATRAAASA